MIWVWVVVSAALVVVTAIVHLAHAYGRHCNCSRVPACRGNCPDLPLLLVVRVLVIPRLRVPRTIAVHFVLGTMRARVIAIVQLASDGYPAGVRANRSRIFVVYLVPLAITGTVVVVVWHRTSGFSVNTRISEASVLILRPSMVRCGSWPSRISAVALRRPE